MAPVGEAAVVDEVFPDERPVFVVGAPRSGTTLLQAILDASPNIGIADELTFFDTILKAQPQLPDLTAPGAIDRLQSLMPKMDHVRYWSDPEAVVAELGRRLRADPQPSWPRVFLYLMRAWADRKGAARCGDKTPWNIRHMETLLRWFPRAQIVHIVRDPRAQIASRRKLPRTSQDVLSNAIKWKLDIDCARRLQATPEQFLEIRYEDLVTTPAETVQRVCEFLDEPFEPQMIAGRDSAELAFRGQAYKEGVTKAVNANSLTSWRRELNASQVRLIEWITGGHFAHYRYERDGSSLGTLAKLPLQAVQECLAWLRFKREEKSFLAADSGIEIRHDSGDLLRSPGGRGIRAAAGNSCRLLR